jgi:hypothetical protein
LNDYYSCDSESGLKNCKEGFVGEFCNIRKFYFKFFYYFFYSLNFIADICATIPCLNDGSCISPDGINYICQCPETHVGPNCELGMMKFFFFFGVSQINRYRLYIR